MLVVGRGGLGLEIDGERRGLWLGGLSVEDGEWEWKVLGGVWGVRVGESGGREFTRGIAI